MRTMHRDIISRIFSNFPFTQLILWFGSLLFAAYLVFSFLLRLLISPDLRQKYSGLEGAPLKRNSNKTPPRTPNNEENNSGNGTHDYLNGNGTDDLCMAFDPSSILVPKLKTPVKLEKKTMLSRDGVTLQYYKVGKGKKYFAVANGLGFSSEHFLMIVAPLLDCYGEDRWTFINWDYRGLFETDQPNRTRRLAIPEHAQDMIQILENENVKTAEVLLGWSMGTQVLLEAVLLEPTIGQKLVLLNGTHGQVFQSAFQPVFRFPYAYRAFNHAVRALKDHPWFCSSVLNFLTESSIVAMFEYFYTTMYAGAVLNEDSPIAKLYGVDFMTKFVKSYIFKLKQNPKHLYNYLCLFQELDAHSVYHLLPEITNETLIVSGLFDLLTPVYLSYELERELPNAEHVVVNLGTHFCFFEQNEVVLNLIINFIEGTRTPKKPKLSKRMSSLEIGEYFARQNKK